MTGVVVSTSITGQEPATVRHPEPISLKSFVREVPLEWSPDPHGRARYELKISAAVKGDLERCAYSGDHTLIRKQVELEVTIVDLQFDKEKASTRLLANDRFGCTEIGVFEPNKNTLLVYTLPRLQLFTEWMLANLGAADLSAPPTVIMPSRVIEGRNLDLAFSPDGRYLRATRNPIDPKTELHGNNGDLVRIFTGRALGVWHPVNGADGLRVATASGDNTVSILDADTGNLLVVLKGHGERVTGVAFSHDDRHIATASNDDTVRIWDATTGVELRKFSFERLDYGVTFSPSDRTLLVNRRKYSTSAASTIEIDPETGKELRDFQSSRVSYRSDGREIAVLSEQTISMYPGAASGMQSGTSLPKKLPRAPRSQLGFDMFDANHIAYMPDGRHVLVSAKNGIHMLDATTGQEVARLLYQSLLLREHSVQGLFVSPDGRWAATNGNDEVLIWNLPLSLDARP